MTCDCRTKMEVLSSRCMPTPLAQDLSSVMWTALFVKAVPASGSIVRSGMRATISGRSGIAGRTALTSPQRKTVCPLLVTRAFSPDNVSGTVPGRY